MSEESDPKVIRRQTFTLNLSKFELLHLRDLFNVNLPPDAQKTVSQALAQQQERPMVEAFLWKKVAAACEEAGLPVGDEAPDFIVAPNQAPSMSVFVLAHDPVQQAEEQVQEGNVFGDEKEQAPDEKPLEDVLEAKAKKKKKRVDKRL